MCARASVSQFLPQNFTKLQFQILMSMQMDAKLIEEQIGTLFVWVGALEGGFGGGGGPSGVSTPKNIRACPQQEKDASCSIR